MADVNQNATLYNVGKIYKNGQEYMLDWTMLSEYNILQQQYSDYQSSIDGIQADLKTSIENKGVTVPSSAALSTYPSYIDQIKTISDTPIAITGAQLYGGVHTVGSHQDISGIDGVVSYATDNLVLIGYMGSRQTYDNYDQKDCHFVRWKKGVSSRKEYQNSIGTGTRYTFRNGGLYITKESDDSYLFTANAYYITDSSNNRPYYCAIRYTVSTDTFTYVAGGSGESYPTQNNMNLYTAAREVSGESRVALFTLRNT